MNEQQALIERYARRADGDRYSPLRPEVQRLLQQRQRALLGLLARAGIGAVGDLRLAEVGCGSGGNLLELLQLGFAPRHLTGIELLPDRLELARARLPAALTLLAGDASAAPLPAASQDLVLQATVFSSLLDDAFQQALADAMWRWLKPGGAVIWYDFTVDNPRNRDVRGVPLARLRRLFPQGQVTARRVTLAPPLARAACRVHPALHDALNLLPFLRTHVLAWVAKPR
ncbi:MAG: class I SAM-dependent methyltransferase [Proteobacteria bacterium]|nr:class I SAM-dependent methyltransferase [Pseudomonadota bacterium]